MARWRHSFYALVPSWLSTGDGEKVLHTLGRVTDGFINRARLSLTARFPTYSGPTGLTMLGEERGIVKGRDESNTGYARRLRGWRGVRGHQVRGNPYAMLYQIWNYFGGMLVREIDSGGNVFTTARDGSESVTHGGVWNWDDAPAWYRFWIKIVPAADQGIAGWGPLSGHPWGASLQPGRGFTIGQKGVTPGDCRVVKNLFRGDHPWHMSGTKPEWAVLVLGEDESPEPDGTWRYWTDNGTPTRAPGWRFWKL